MDARDGGVDVGCATSSSVVASMRTTMGPNPSTFCAPGGVGVLAARLGGTTIADSRYCEASRSARYSSYSQRRLGVDKISCAYDRRAKTFSSRSAWAPRSFPRWRAGSNGATRSERARSTSRAVAPIPTPRSW